MILIPNFSESNTNLPNPLLGSWTLKSMTKSGCKSASDGNGVLPCSNDGFLKCAVTTYGANTYTTVSAGTPNVTGKYSIQGNTIITNEDNATQKMTFKVEGETLTVSTEPDSVSGCVIMLTYKKS